MGNPIGRPMNNKRINKSEFNPRNASTSKYGRAMFANCINAKLPTRYAVVIFQRSLKYFTKFKG